MKSLKTSQRSKTSIYWKDCQKARRILSKLNLRKTDTKERQFENRIATLLDTQKFNEHFIDQRSSRDSMTQVPVFGSNHRPDMSIGVGGTAFEVKLTTHGNKVKDALSQAIFYRTHYRFVIIVLVDITKNGKIYELLKSRKSLERKMIKDFERELNIFVVILRGR